MIFSQIFFFNIYLYIPWSVVHIPFTIWFILRQKYINALRLSDRTDYSCWERTAHVEEWTLNVWYGCDLHHLNDLFVHRIKSLPS